MRFIPTNSHTGRRLRHGMNLIEVLIVIGIMVALVGIAVPMSRWALDLDHKESATQLANTYERLRDEAALRNLTFRIVYRLEERKWEVEVSESAAMLSATPEDREKFEAAQREKLERTASRFRDPEDDQSVDEEGMSLETATFTKVQGRFTTSVDLPSGVRFGGVYTPAYGEMIKPSTKDFENLDEDEYQVVYSYILPSGLSEHTLVTLVDEENDRTGYSVEVEPMTGVVHLDAEIRSWQDRFDFVPEEGPRLNQ